MTYKEFKKYFWSFYGKTGLYPQTLSGLTTLEFIKAYDMRMANKSIAFEGDTFDREMVRDIILASRGKFSV
jgi:hypothetical protein